MAEPEGSADRRQGLEARAPAEADAQLPDISRRGALRGGPRAVELRERSTGTLEEGCARLGQPNLAGRALQQLAAELLLELADRRAQRRLGHVQPLRRTTE